jgi:hypothetical protein
MSAPTTRSTRRRKLLLAAVSTAVVLALVEVAARFATVALANGLSRIGPVVLLPLPTTSLTAPPDPTRPRTYVAPDAELGWCTQPDVRTEFANTNAQAARGGPAEGYAVDVPPGKVRVLTFGDSFTHGDEVDDAATWQAQLAEIRGDVEAVNFGVPGYGADQAFLRWRRESARLRSTVSLLCIWPEDICRNLNLERLYMAPTGMPAAKPRFLLRDGALELVGQPCVGVDGDLAAARAALLPHDVWARPADLAWRWPYHSRLLRFVSSTWSMLERRDLRAAIYRGDDPRGNEVTAAICRQFAVEARARGTRPVVVLIPMRDLLGEFPGGERPLPLARMLAAQGVETWDLSPEFASATDLDALNPPKRHMTKAGNRRIAEALAQRLPRPE